MNSELTLGGFIKQLAVQMEEQGIHMPLKDDKPWHMLFYRLRSEFRGQGSTFLQSLEFDWDGPYPKSQDVSDFIQGLHWTGSVSALNPAYERMIVPSEVQAAWKREGHALADGDQALLSRAIDLAKIEFNSQVAA